MKKRLFSIVLTLIMLTGLCMNMTATVSAGTWTIPTWERKGEPETGLKMFTEEKINPGRWSATGAGALDDFYGLKDSAGNIVLPADYLGLMYLGPNRLFATKTGAYSGIITLDGTVIYPFTLATDIDAIEIPGVADPLFIIREGYANDGGAENTGLYDWNGNAILRLENYSAIVYLGDKYFYISEKNSGMRGIYEYGVGITLPCQNQYRSIEYFEKSDLFRVENNEGLVGVIDKNGNQILPCVYEYIPVNGYAQGCLVVCRFTDETAKNHFQQYGRMTDPDLDCLEDALVDSQGTYLIPFGQYDDIVISSDGYARAGMWTGQYKYSGFGGSSGESSGGFYKIYNYTDSYKLSDLIAEKGGTPLPEAPPDSTGTPTVSALFKDVRDSDYFADAVLWAVEKNITSGTSATTFSPGATCSKAQILTFLWRANGSPEPTAANPFTDIKTTDYFYKAALWAAEKGLVSGSTFGSKHRLHPRHDRGILVEGSRKPHAFQ